MPSTTNFGWTTPADTDLVKDGASAIRTLGNGIDTSFVDLKGGTTGQILSKASNTDLDFTWIANDQGDITAVTAGTGLSGGGTTGAVTLTNSMATEIAASGDIIVGTGSGTFDNLPIGSTGQVLTADTTVSPYKVKWASIATGAYTSLATGSLSTNTVTISAISGSYKHLQLFLYDFYPNTDGNLYLRLNGNTGNVYGYANINNRENTVSYSGDGASEIRISDEAIDNTSKDNSATINIYNYADSNAFKTFDYSHIVYSGGANSYYMGTGGGGFRSTTAITSITIFWESTYTFSGGSYILYGVN